MLFGFLQPLYRWLSWLDKGVIMVGSCDITTHILNQIENITVVYDRQHSPECSIYHMIPISTRHRPNSYYAS